MANEMPGTPEKHSVPESPIKQILSFLSSMQLGIILLLLLAVISVFATMRSRVEQLDVTVETIYTSGWFVGIMAFSALNLLLCTVQRIRPLTRQALQPNRVMSGDAIKNMAVNRAIKVKTTDSEPLQRVQNVFRANGLQTVVSDLPAGPVVFGEKGKFGYFGSIVTHISLLIILLGAMYGGLTGFETDGWGKGGDSFNVAQRVFAPENNSLKRAVLQRLPKTLVNFDATVQKVELTYPEGPKVRPKVWADITVVEKNGKTHQGRTSINNPMRFGAVTLYQKSYYWIPQISVRDAETGEEIQALAPMYDSSTRGEHIGMYFGNPRANQVFIPEKDLVIEFPLFLVDFTMTQGGMPVSATQHPSRPNAVYEVKSVDGKFITWGLAPLNNPKLIETEKGNVEVALSGYENAVALAVTKNTGRPLLFAGAVLMLIGLYMSFFLFPRRFWAVYDDKKATILVGGRGYRNRLGIEQLMEKIESEILSREGE